MIGSVRGTVLDRSLTEVLVDVNGVGYRVLVSPSTLVSLGGTGSTVTLHTHLVVREDAHTLYGFGSGEERTAFRQLIRISGIGARTALAVLSGLSVAELAQAVATQEPGRRTRVPGIGRKTAERLLLELKGKLGEAAVRPAPGPASDILDALLGLGYSEKEALAAIKRLAPGVPVTEGIRAALKALAKS